VSGAVETTLAGRYRLDEVIGRGGMSTVYRATDQTLGRTVAVKVLLPALADQDPTYSVRFEREARAAAGLASSAVVTVYDTGVDAGSHYIVMEYLAGRSLDEILRHGRLEIAEAVRIARHVADALAAAHAAGILHRDIKPANVMVTEDGSVKVLDFGIARRIDGTTITQAASVVGTAAYMPPERALGQPGDARADIYSLGCLLYATLTGEPPFQGEVSAAVLHQHLNAPPRAPSERGDGVPPALDSLILAMLAKAPEARPASAAEVRGRLAALSDDAGPSDTTAVTAPLLPPHAATTATIPYGRDLRPGRNLLADHRRRAVLMAILTGVVALIALALLSGGGSSERASSVTHQPSTRHVKTHSAPAARPATNSQPAPAPRPKTPQPAPGTPPGHGGEPPGHGGTPPGKAKKAKKAKPAKP
jgi:serine/threonine-protein kinase